MSQSTKNIIRFIQNIQVVLKVIFIDMMPLAVKIEIATNIIVLSNKLHGSHANLLEKLKIIILSNNEILWQCTNLKSYTDRTTHHLTCTEAHLQRCSVCDHVKIFFTSKFSCLLFCNPTNKTETGKQIGGGLLITNHLDQSL